MATDDTGFSNQNIKEDTPSTPLTREALYALVWAEPMLKVAARYNVSSSYMARVCTLLNVPRPERGYWARLAVGKASPMPPLPEARPSDELVWSRGGQHINKVARPLPRPPSRAQKRKSNLIINHLDQHPLVKGARELFEAGRLSYNADYLKPTKRLLVDLAVTKTGLDKALVFANNLFLQLEEYSYSVVLAPKGEIFHRADVDEHEVPKNKRGYSHNNLWYPYRCTVVYIGTVAIGLTIIEMSEELEARYINGEYIREQDYVPPRRGRNTYDYSWTTKKDFSTGRLRLQAYSPYPRAKWVNHWQETKTRDLGSQLKAIVKDLERAVVDIARLVEEGERQAELERQKWEIEQEKWRREEAERRTAEALKDSKEELLQIIKCWAESNRIEQFFQDIEGRTANLSGDKKIKMLERLKLARELVGSVDALDHFLAWRSLNER